MCILLTVRSRFITYYELTEVLGIMAGICSIPPVQDFVSGESVSSRIVYEYPSMNGEDVIGVYAPIEVYEWAVVTEAPAKEAYEGITSMKNFLYAAIILAIIVVSWFYPYQVRNTPSCPNRYCPQNW